jgi:hypothetical protein
MSDRMNAFNQSSVFYSFMLQTCHVCKMNFDNDNENNSSSCRSLSDVDSVASIENHLPKDHMEPIQTPLSHCNIQPVESGQRETGL